MIKYDLAIIGAGSAGYVAAIRATQLGLKVACIEKYKKVGGTCLNVGCIPSKNLLNVANDFSKLKNFENHGIKIKSYELDLAKVMQSKNDAVTSLTQGIEALFIKNKVKKYQGVASFVSDKELEINHEDGTKTNIEAENIIIATGSKPLPLKGFGFNNKSIITSTQALSLSSVPKSMAVIGAGVIGLELSSIWNNFGSKVKVFEYGNKILPNADHDASTLVQKSLKEQGIEIKTNQKELSLVKVSDKNVILQSITDEKKEQFEFEKLLISIGRKPNTEELKLENINLELDNEGFIKVNEDFETNVENVYAIGDIIKGPMLAHKASEEAVCVVEKIAGHKKNTVDYNIIPSVIYIKPEFASVGFAEHEVKEAGIDYIAFKFPFVANSRARAVLQSDGFVKLICHKDSLRVLGAHILGSTAGELIQQVVMLMSLGLSVKEIAHLPHSHPGYSEALKEAALGILNEAIHI